MPEIGQLSGSLEKKNYGYAPRSRVYAGPDWGWQTEESFKKIQEQQSSPLGILNGAARFVSNTYQQTSQAIYNAIPKPISSAIDAVVTPVSQALEQGYAKTPMGMAEEGAIQLGENVGTSLGNTTLGAATGFLLGAVIPGPGEGVAISKGIAKLKFRPNVTGMRNADVRAILGDYVTDPTAVAARTGRRLESDPIYKLLQKGRPSEPGETMTSMPNLMSPHHRVDVKGSIPFFEGSTEAANIQRRADLAVGDIYPGNDPRNYIGLWDGPLSGKASKKTGVYSTDHQDVHKSMENLRRKLGLKAKGGTDAVAALPDDVKTGLLADLSMRDELAINKVLATRMDMIHEAFPDMSYDEIKDTILKNPKRFANLSRTSEGYLYSLIAP